MGEELRVAVAALQMSLEKRTVVPPGIKQNAFL